MKVSFVVLGVLAALLGGAGPSVAQTTSGSIAGVVRDTTGAVLPGVTVEAASPALIERSKSAVTDSEGLYRIVDLRPGTYTVTFTLSGFSTVRREGLVLNAGFAAPLNAEMPLGSLEETVTVTGASPVVDTQNVRSQSVLTREMLDTLPTAKNFQAFNALTLGATSFSGREVGGDRGESLFGLSIHGAGAGLPMMDGMTFGGVYGSVHRFAVNNLAVQEAVMETNGAAQSDSGGLNVNIVLKDGGNLFSSAFETEGTGKALQSSNLNDELRGRGLLQPNRTRGIYETAFVVGGPVIRDKLWFLTAHRWQGAKTEIAGVYFNKLQGTLFYEQDLTRPAFSDNNTRDNLVRLTWQATARNKISALADIQRWCWCYYYIDQSRVGFADQSRGFHVPESTYHMDIDPNNVFQLSWTFPATSRLLIEAGWGERNDRDVKRVPDETGVPDPAGIVARPVLELSTGIAYGSMFAGSAQWLDDYGDQYNNLAITTRAAVSYITGAHALKVGFTNLSGERPAGGKPLYNVGYAFRNRVPVEVNQVAGPHYQLAKVKLALGVYAQDQWTLKRLTINPGVRFDHLNMYHPEQTRPAGEFTPEFHFDAVYDKPNWKDISPRVGVAWDMFGDATTALKGSVGRYITVTYSPAVSANTNPSRAIAGTTRRTWNDFFFGPGDPRSGNYVPDCDLHSKAANAECGAMSDQRFGTPTPVTRYADDVAVGWGARAYNWQSTIAVQHQLAPGIGLTASYFRTTAHKFNVADNLLVTPQDFDSFCVTAPSDPRLKGGGGYQVCGLYDVKPSKFGLNDTIISQADNFGSQSRAYNGFDVQLNARLANGASLTGGVSAGRTVSDTCDVADVPGQFCRNTVPFSGDAQIKINGSYPLPWGLQASAVFQNLPGVPRSATAIYTNAQIVASLGRNLAQCGTAAVCNAVRAVSIVEPNTLFENRQTQLDVRLTRVFRFGRARFSPRFDVYNLFNGANVLRLNNTFGAVWLRPLDVLGGRLLKFGGRIDF